MGCRICARLQSRWTRRDAGVQADGREPPASARERGRNRWLNATTQCGAANVFRTLDTLSIIRILAVCVA